MPRHARVVAVNIPHHITQRGNDRQKVFFEDEDRQLYLRLLDKQAHKFAVDLIGFTLMSNHIHLILVPPEPNALAEVLGNAHSQYTQRFNFRYQRTGHLWQNRFFSCPLDRRHLWTALCYVERNPVRAGLVDYAWDYPWSSARAHVTGTDDTGLLGMDEWQAAFTPAEWKRMLMATEDPRALTLLRKATLQGRFPTEGTDPDPMKE